jgi:O-antigen/teichoic acid export membrane protein
MSRLKRTTLIHFGSQVLVSVSGFLATFAIARLLGSDVLGKYALVVALVIWFSFPVAAVGSATTKRMSEGEKPGRYLGAGVVAIAVVVPVLVGIVLLGRSFFSGYVGAPVTNLLAVLIAATAVFKLVKNGLNGQKKVGISGLSIAAHRVFRSIIQVGLILLGFRLGGIIAGHIAGLVMATVLALYFYEVTPALPGREELRSLLEYARYSWLGTLQSQSFGWMDTIVLGFFVTSSQIGIYEVAWNLASVLILVSVSIRTTLFPEISDLGAEDRYEEIHEFIGDGLLFTGVFAIPGLVGAAVVGPRVLAIYRPEFSRGAGILVLLVLARFVAAYGTLFLTAVNGIDRPDIAFRINAAFIATNLALNVVLVAAFGWYGAAVATGLSATLMLAASYAAIRRLIGDPAIPGVEIGKEVTAALVMGAALLILRPLVARNHYLTVLMVGAGAAVYVAILLAISGRIRGKVGELLPPAGQV